MRSNYEFWRNLLIWPRGVAEVDDVVMPEDQFRAWKSINLDPSNMLMIKTNL